MGLIEAGIEAAGQIGGSLIDRIFAKRDAQRTLDTNKQLADYQYSKDLEMWNSGNKYNSPEEQMARLKAAGLNPNLVYGSGAVAGQTASTLPKYNAPTADFQRLGSVKMPSLAGVLTPFVDLQAKKAGIANTNADTTNKQNEASLFRTEAETKVVELKAKMAQLDKFNMMTPFEKAKIQEEINQIQNNIKLGTARFGLESEKWDVEKNIRAGVLDKIKNEIDLQELEKEIKNKEISGKGLDNLLKSLQADVLEYKANLARNNTDPNANLQQQFIQRIAREFGVDVNKKDGPIMNAIKLLFESYGIKYFEN